MLCSLCEQPTEFFWKDTSGEYVKCTNCKAVLLLESCFVSAYLEKERYKTHNNNVEDLGYQKFASPITEAILRDFSPTHKGLDFGCGTGPVISSQLKKKNFKIRLYDPFFKNDESALNLQYDYIICCEVMEHFHKPKEEFKRLFKMLKENGKLYCKTSLLTPITNFASWYYKNDPTHVVFYSEESLRVLQKSIGFSKVEITPELIIFSR